MPAHVFAYGSLMQPSSLARTLPGQHPARCRPAWLAGYERTFDVAFPNDGSQPDKSYLDLHGARPPVVLFANVRPTAGSRVNGVCIPVDDSDLAALRIRERRYDLVDVTDLVGPYPGPGRWHGAVLAFVGRPEFTAPGDIARGTAAQDYLDAIIDGAGFWERRAPGFAADVAASTRMPAAVAPLQRVDLSGPAAPVTPALPGSRAAAGPAPAARPRPPG